MLFLAVCVQRSEVEAAQTHLEVPPENLSARAGHAGLALDVARDDADGVGRLDTSLQGGVGTRETSREPPKVLRVIAAWQHRTSFVAVELAFSRILRAGDSFCSRSAFRRCSVSTICRGAVQENDMLAPPG